MKSKHTNNANKGEIIIRDTYFNEGKIVFLQKQIDYNLLPRENSSVKVYMGKTGNNFFETNLVFTTNNSARINNVKIKKWFDDERLKKGDTFMVEIIDKKTYRIYK